ncbi:hypothetical protein CDL12_16965 [Handroanthus impetiginosus]|uniref:C3H1-type domain-containing protein n=1 Tax=Handroanthus impetiginosus TaxID=429701 RepID=A0A2G9GYT5_9LAMI|nr:hypothetical protein CDL12_16965 [Handroanthus impetiginosus]
MSGRMSEKPASVSRAPLASHRQIVVPEDCSSKVGVKLNSSCSNAAQLKKSLAWYVALKPNPSKPLDERISQIPQVRWKCPLKFALNTGWLVAAGEGSQGAEAQKCGETTVPEVVYPHLSAVPPRRGEYGDDSRIPIIPIIPIEEAAAAEMPIHTSASVNTCNNSQTMTSPKGPSVPEKFPLPHCKPSGSQDRPVNDISPPAMLSGLENVDVEVAVAAAATVAAIMESKEQIDTELLFKFLTDPEMVQKLIDERVKLEHGTTPAAPLPNTSIPVPGTIPTPVADKLANECTGPVSRAIPSNSKLQAVNQTLALPCTKMETAIDRSALITSSKILSPLPQSNSEVPSIKNLTVEPRQPAHAHIHHIAGVKQVTSLMPSTLRPDEETIKRLINLYGAPDIAGVVPVASPNPSTSNPRVEAIKKLIDKYGSPNSAGVRMVPPRVPSISRPNVEEINQTVYKYAVPDHGWDKPFLGPHAFLPAPTPFMEMPPRPNLCALPNALESNYPATGTSHFASLSPVTIPPLPVDLNYHKSPIEQQVEKHETWGYNLPKFGQPGNYMQGLKLAHNTTEMDPKYQKPCIYFCSSKGCLNGYNCPYQHDASKQSRASGMVDSPVAKKVKFS